MAGTPLLNMPRNWVLLLLGQSTPTQVFTTSVPSSKAPTKSPGCTPAFVEKVLIQKSFWIKKSSCPSSDPERSGYVV